MSNIWFDAAAWMGLAFAASLISIRLGISVSLVEIGVGILAGNFLGLQTNDWVNFLASLQSRFEMSRQRATALISNVDIAVRS